MVILVVFVIVGLLFKAGRKSRKTDQYDNYAAGAAIPKGRYNYTVNFYNPLSTIIEKYLKDVVDAFYMKLTGFVTNVGDGIRKLYTGYVGNYIMYIVVFLAFLILIQLRWSVF